MALIVHGFLFSFLGLIVVPLRVWTRVMIACFGVDDWFMVGGLVSSAQPPGAILEARIWDHFVLMGVSLKVTGLVHNATAIWAGVWGAGMRDNALTVPQIAEAEKVGMNPDSIHLYVGTINMVLHFAGHFRMAASIRRSRHLGQDQHLLCLDAHCHHAPLPTPSLAHDQLHLGDQWGQSGDSNHRVWTLGRQLLLTGPELLRPVRASLCHFPIFDVHSCRWGLHHPAVLFLVESADEEAGEGCDRVVAWSFILVGTPRRSYV